LTSALMVGGTVGAVGTLQLSSNEMRWSTEDRALLQGGIPLQTQGASVPLDLGSRELRGTVVLDDRNLPVLALRLQGKPSVPLKLQPDDLKKLQASAGALAIAMGSANEAAGKLSTLRIVALDGKEAIPVTLSVPSLPINQLARLITNRPPVVSTALAASSAGAGASAPDRNELVEDLGKVGAAQSGVER